MRRTALLGSVAGLFAVMASLLPTPAIAQVGYPPPACTVTASVQNFGAVNIGDTVRLVLAPTCVFAPGTQLTVLVNGQSIGVKVADANGFVTVQVTVLSATQLSIDDPVLVSSVCGRNSIAASGFSTVAGGVVTHSASFDVVCRAPVVQATKSTIAFTGAWLLRWLIVGLALTAVGFVIATAARRRRPARGR